jgi:hypothetical protein
LRDEEEGGCLIGDDCYSFIERNGNGHGRRNVTRKRVLCARHAGHWTCARRRVGKTPSLALSRCALLATLRTRSQFCLEAPPGEAHATQRTKTGLR